MSRAKMEALQARLDVMAAALAAMAQAMPAELASAVRDELRREVARRTDGVALAPGADAAAAGDLGSVLNALGDRISRRPGRATLPG